MSKRTRLPQNYVKLPAWAVGDERLNKTDLLVLACFAIHVGNNLKKRSFMSQRKVAKYVGRCAATVNGSRKKLIALGYLADSGPATYGNPGGHRALRFTSVNYWPDDEMLEREAPKPVDDEPIEVEPVEVMLEAVQDQPLTAQRIGKTADPDPWSNVKVSSDFDVF